MTYQRRGRYSWPVEIYGVKIEANPRGERRKVVDLSAPAITCRGWAIADADRFQNMQIDGDQEIVMFELGVSDHPAFHTRQVTSEGRVFFDGYWWDIVHPPKQSGRRMNRHVRHWRLSLRRRPLGD